MYVDTTYINFHTYTVCDYIIYCTYLTQAIGRDYEIMYFSVNTRITCLYYKIKYFFYDLCKQFLDMSKMKCNKLKC